MIKKIFLFWRKLVTRIFHLENCEEESSFKKFTIDSQSQGVIGEKHSEKKEIFTHSKKSNSNILEGNHEFNEFITNDSIAEKAPRTIIVGIDLGTNSTKVIYQIAELIDQKNAFLFNFQSDIPGFPVGSLPSIVVLCEGKFYFGDEAYRRKHIADAFFPSFKMCLGCYYKTIPCKKCNTHGISSFQQGWYISDPFKINAETITEAYLAYVISIVRDFLEKKYSKHFDLDIYYNISFPLNFIEDKNKNFSKVLFLIDKISHKIYQGISVKELFNIFISIASEFEGERPNNYEIIEETRAATYSVIKSGFLEYDKYAVIDIGASTTDISIFRYWGSIKNKPKFFYYADASFPIGGNDFDISIFNFIKNNFRDHFISESELLNKVKIAKEKMQEENRFQIKELDIYMNKDEINRICKNNFEEIQINFSKIIRERAFRKEESLSMWESINILLLGGGARWEYLEKILRKSPFYGNNVNWEPIFIESAVPENLNIEESILNAYEIKKNFFYYYVAHGLSYQIFDIYDSVHPHNVPPLQKIKEKINLPDRDELYPK